MRDSPENHAPEPIAALPTSITSVAPPAAPSIDSAPAAPIESVASASSGAAVGVADKPASETPLPEKQQSQPGSQALDGGATVGAQAASSAEPVSPTTAEPQSGKPEETKDTELSSSTPAGDNASSTPVVASAARVPTPSSRTSTPPLAHAKKKFSSVSVTKEFLSKAASPVPAPAKLVRPTAVAPPSQTTSKLLSTKLTTVPSSKTTTSPKPPASGAAPASAPWASIKPAPADSSAPALQHPAPTRGMGHMPNVAMGSGQGLGAAARRAWGPVGAGERRGPPGGLSREFPTAKEVADGKRKAMLSAQAIAQAEAAHNQAILADLNVFTHLEPNAHRWDEEDEDDDMIDFGDGRTYSGLSHAPEQHDAPVAKSERFGEDFDRSWPHKRDEARGGRQDRVLFNPNERRHEPAHPLGLPTGTHPSRVMSREPPARGGHERALPPHLADSGRMLPPHMSAGAAPAAGHGPSERRASWRVGSSERDAPPHLSETRDMHRGEPPVRAPPSRPPPAPRAAPPPSMAAHAPQHAAPEPAKPAPPPTAAAAPPAPAAAPATAAPAGPSGEMQAAEMHTAAEKARLRRLAEEAEREAAAERARQKARELAERFGAPKTAATANAASAPPAPASAAPAPSSAPPPPPPGLSKPPHPPPGFTKPVPQVTIASRPRPEHGSPEATTGHPPVFPEQKVPTAADRASSWRRTEPLPEQPASGVRSSGHGHDFARRPSHGQDPSRQADRSELRRNQRDLPPHSTRDVPPHVQQQRALSSHGAQSQQQQQREGEPPRSPVRPKAPPGLEHQVQAARAAAGVHDHIASPHPSKREANFDTMLARIQAAMAKSRLSPPLDAKGSTSPSEAVKHSAEAASTPLDAATTPAAAVSSNGPSPAETGAATPASPKKAAKKAAPSAVTLPHLPPDYFDATQGGIARSPPPAWRQYTVKLPKVSANKGSIPRGRMRAFEANRSQPHRGWAQTFEPPLDQYAQGRVLADVLLPQPIGRRFARQVETGPIVSISPRTLTKFQRKTKRQPEPRSLPGDALSFGPSTRPSAPETPVTQPTPPISRKTGKAAGVAAPSPQGEAPSVSSSTLPAGTDAGAAGKPPAVRFMVSSELDGDSLLDEVNKMSLEHIGEGEDKTPAPAAPESSTTKAPIKPGTPPPPPAPRTNPTSPNTAPGPWAKSTLAFPVTSPARDDPQREHLKSVWEQASESTLPTTATKAALSAPSAPASAPSQPDTPLYPTLNSPATAPDPASLKPASYGIGVGQFGARGQFGSYSSPFMGSGATSPDGVVGGMGVQYGIMGQGRGAANTNGFQQGLWAPSPGFPSSLGGAGYYGGKDAQKGSPGFPNKEFGPDYRYNKSASQVQQAQVQPVPQVQPVQAGFQGNYNYAQHQHVQHAQQQFRGQAGVYGHVGYGPMGFGTSMAGPRNASAGRFPAVPANGEYQPQGYDQSYYSGQYHQHQHHQPQAQSFGQNGGSNGMEGRARKMW